MEKDPNWQIWSRSYRLSRSFWALHQLLLKYRLDQSDRSTNCDTSEASDESQQDDINPEYLKFIEETRRHQAERERLKEEQLAKNQQCHADEYYLDISQVNTLVEANLVEPPELGKPERDGTARREPTPLEMYIDEDFRRKCDELKPSYWPAVPINLKPYLNSKRK